MSTANERMFANIAADTGAPAPVMTGVGAPGPAPVLNPVPAHHDPALGPADPLVPPDPMKAVSARAPVPAAAPPDPAAAYAAGPQYATETTRSKTEQGMSDADAAAQRELLGTAKGAQEKATGSEVEARRAAIEADEQEQTRRLNEAAEEQKKIAAKQAVLDLQEAEVKRKLQAGADWRPDRSELFSGSTGAARGILAAISVIAGGLMQGRGMTRDNQFLNAINEMIDENVADQVRQNSASIQFLREQKGDVQSAAAELKKRQLDFATQKLNARAQLSKIPAAQAGLTAFNDAAAARTAEWQAEQEKALRKQVSSTISRHTAPVAPREAKPEAERSPQQARAEAVTRTINDLGPKAGLIRDANGRWTVGGGALPPGLVEGVKSIFGAGTPINDAAEQLAEQYGRLQSQGAIGLTERPELREQVGMNTLTREQLASKLNALEISIAPLSKLSDERAQKAASTPPANWSRLGTR
jgi:hypothetical protein